MRTCIVLLASMSFVTSAAAEVYPYWDQSDVDPSITPLIDQEFPDFPSYSSYMVMDVSTGSPGWQIGLIKTYFTSEEGFDGSSVTTARLNIFEKTSALPSGVVDPSMGMEVPVRCVPGPNGWELIASDLDIYLRGDYWIGLTPIAELEADGQLFHQGAPIVGDDTAWRNPGGSLGFGSGWTTAGTVLYSWTGAADGALLVAWVPEPSSLALLSLGALGLIRRR